MGTHILNFGGREASKRMSGKEKKEIDSSATYQCQATRVVFVVRACLCGVKGDKSAVV